MTFHRLGIRLPVCRSHVASVVVLLSLLLFACGDGDDNDQGTHGMTSGTPAYPNDLFPGWETPRPTGNAQPADEITITIGNLTDMTGVASSGVRPVNMALEDAVDYYNDNNLIPGVRLKIINYDEQYDPSRDIPGYEWLRERGADLIWTPIPSAASTLKHRADDDEFPVFTAAANLEVLSPPGYLFSMGVIPQHNAYTLLDWIAENHWDYHANGPAKLGVAAWGEAYQTAWAEGAEEYARAHPEQYKWEGAHLTEFGFAWDAEIQALKDCDYIYVNALPLHFVENYRNAGYDATFLGDDTHLAFMGMIDKADLWEEFDGMLVIRAAASWWNETGPVIDLINHLVRQYHPESYEDIIRSGAGYLGVFRILGLLDIIAEAASDAGPENLDSNAIYEAAVQWSFLVDDLAILTFDENKRYAGNYAMIYEMSAEERDLSRAHSEPIGEVTRP